MTQISDENMRLAKSIVMLLQGRFSATVVDTYGNQIQDSLINEGLIAAALQAKDDERERAVKEARDRALDECYMLVGDGLIGEVWQRRILELKEKKQ